jgi:gluconolactonase
MKLRSLFLTTLVLGPAALSLAPGCSSEPDKNENTTGGVGTGTGGSLNPTGGVPSGGKGGSTSMPAGAGSGGKAVGGTSSGGSGNTAGMRPGTGGTAAGGTSGGSAGNGGTSGGSGGTSGNSGNSGTGGSGTGGSGSGGTPGTTLKGGASAAFICKAGATYGDPLAGMGQVTTISAPTMGNVTYFAFIEGPVWVGSVNKLFFSDIVSPERIWTVTPPSTTPVLFLEGSGSNGLAVDSNDQLLVADQVQKRISRIDPSSASPAPVNVVSTGSAKPNDLVMRSDGSIYFSDPDVQRGVYHVSPAGTVSAAVTVVMNPNGVALSPDETKLYVGNVSNRQITVFTLGAGGAIDAASATLFATTTGNTLDGMAVDCAGNVYASTQTGVEVISPTGAPLGMVPTGEASNVTFGGADRKTLYATSRSQLKAVTLAVPGLPD